MLDKFNLDGKVAVVTGASQGLGQGMAKGLALSGADIVGVGIGNMDETKKMVESAGKKFLGIKADLINSSVQGLGEIIKEAVNHIWES